MAAKKPEANELLDAFRWLEEATDGSHRSVGIRTSGDSDFIVKCFENAMCRKEVRIKGIYAFRRAVKVVGKTLDSGAA